MPRCPDYFVHFLCPQRTVSTPPCHRISEPPGHCNPPTSASVHDKNIVCISRPRLLSTCKNHPLSRQSLGSHRPKRALNCMRIPRNPAKTTFQDAHRETVFSYKTHRALPLQEHQTASAALDTALLSPLKTRYHLPPLNSPISRTPTSRCTIRPRPLSNPKHPVPSLQDTEDSDLPNHARHVVQGPAPHRRLHIPGHGTGRARERPHSLPECPRPGHLLQPTRRWLLCHRDWSRQCVPPPPGPRPRRSPR